jgi:hypothetical protein
MSNRFETFARRTPMTDLVLGYTVDMTETPVVCLSPSVAEHVVAFLTARKRSCRVQPQITTEVDARATLQAHRHHVGSPCLQKRAALRWMRENGRYVLTSQFD